MCRYTKLKCLIGSSRRVPLQTPSNAGNLSFETEVFLRVAEERMSSYNDDNIKPYKRKQKRERKNELPSIKGGFEKGTDLSIRGRLENAISVLLNVAMPQGL